LSRYTIILLIILPMVLIGFVDPGFNPYYASYVPEREYFSNSYGKCAQELPYRGLSYFQPHDELTFDATNLQTLDNDCREFIDANYQVFEIESDELDLFKANNRMDRWWITYLQKHNNIEVLSSRVDFRVFGNGNLAFCGSKIIDQFDSQTPVISSERVIDLIAEYYPDCGSINNMHLVYYPQVDSFSAIGKLSWQVDVYESLQKHWRVFISAVNGKLLFEYNLVNFYDVNGKVYIEYLPLYYDDTLATSTFDFGDLSLNYIRSTQTDDRGDYNISSYLSYSMPLKSWLTGAWVEVEDNEGENARYNQWLTPPTEHSFTWIPNAASVDTDEVNLYYHTNFIHQYYERLDPEMAALDYPVPARAGIDGTPENAFWDGYGTNYGSGGASTRNFALFANIIYHEYTHGITGWIYEGVHFPYSGQSGAMNEAYSDYFAVTNCNEPRIGYKCQKIGGSFFRTMDNHYRMPEDWVGEVHGDGRIIGGAFWDLRESVRISFCDTLIHFTRYATPATFDAFVPECLFTDDDNEDLTDGTPHHNEIFESFGIHGIGPGIFPKFTINYEYEDLGDGDGYFEAGEAIAIRPVINADASFAWPDIEGLNGYLFLENRSYGVYPGDTVSGFPVSISAGSEVEGDEFCLNIGPDAQPHFADCIITYFMDNSSRVISDTIKLLIGHPQVLLIDDSPDSNSRIASFYCDALEKLNVTYKYHHTFPSGAPVEMEDFPVMIWFTGDDTLGEGIDSQDTLTIVNYLDTGGDIILTGQNLTNQFEDYFLEDNFGAVHKADTGSIVVDGIGSGPLLFSDERLYLFGSPGASNQKRLTSISPIGGTAFATYQNGDTCAVRFDNGLNKTVVFGFGIEGIGGGPYSLHMDDILARIFHWFDLQITDINEIDLPEKITVQAYPNPFNSVCKIDIRGLEDDPNLDVKIYNISGNVINGFGSEMMKEDENSYRIIWNGKDQSGNDVNSGIYFISIRANNQVHNSKVILLK